MYAGKLIFAQLMDHLPLHTFRRCAARYPGKYSLLSCSHLDQFLSMSLAQLKAKEPAQGLQAVK